MPGLEFNPDPVEEKAAPSRTQQPKSETGRWGDLPVTWRRRVAGTPLSPFSVRCCAIMIS